MNNVRTVPADNDPADRIIIATARALSATLVTRDKRLIQYGGAVTRLSWQHDRHRA